MSAPAKKIRTVRDAAPLTWRETRHFGLFPDPKSGSLVPRWLDDDRCPEAVRDIVFSKIVGPVLGSESEKLPDKLLSDDIYNRICINDKIIGYLLRLRLGDWTKDDKSCIQAVRRALLKVIDGETVPREPSEKGLCYVEIFKVDNEPNAAALFATFAAECSDSPLGLMSNFHRASKARTEGFGSVNSSVESSQNGFVNSYKSEQKSGKTHQQGGPSIDLEQEFFSQGPEVAQARLTHLAAEMASRFPELKSSLKSNLVAAIEGSKAPANKPTEPEATPHRTVAERARWREESRAESSQPALSAQETVEALKKLREPYEIDRFLKDSVVGRTWGNLDENYIFAMGLNDHLRTLKLRVACSKDNQPSLLRCYPTTNAPQGAFYFEHSSGGSRSRHGGATTIGELKVVPEGADSRRKTTKIVRGHP
jgi:hypothetical protein